MADINVKQLSKAIKIDLDNLLAQMKAAGLSHKSEKDIVSTEDKKVLLKEIEAKKRREEKEKEKEEIRKLKEIESQKRREEEQRIREAAAKLKYESEKLKKKQKKIFPKMFINSYLEQ